MVDEIWRAVPGFEGLYEVSSAGRIRSLPGGHRHAKLLDPKLPEKRETYKTVSLHKDGKRKRVYVHAAVAAAFLPPRPSPQHELRHFDGDRGNNRAGNLRWGTGKDNAEDRARHGMTAVAERHGRAAFTNAEAAAILAEYAAGGISARAIALRLGVNPSTVQRLVAREQQYPETTALEARRQQTPEEGEHPDADAE